MKSIAFMFLLFVPFFSFAQIKLDASTNNTTVNSCRSLFFDSGGNDGSYQNNEDRIVTFQADAGNVYKLNFTTVDLGEDNLFVYNGQSTTAPLITVISGSQIPAEITTSGEYLTFRFVSDAANTHLGWRATLNCFNPHQLPENNIRASALQVAPSTQYTVDQLVKDKLVTGCLKAFNVHYTGDPISISYFTSFGTPVGFADGVILSTGKVEDAEGPNGSASTGSSTSGGTDTQLDAIASDDIEDAAVLEFDFIPSSNLLSFNYIFASDEYPNYANTSYNDVFAFFLSGPNPAGGTYTNENIAKIPGTNLPVTINNLNNGQNNTGPCEYCQYYVNNNYVSFGTNNPNCEYDGLTTELTAQAAVTSCQTYHIKLAVGDVGDSSYDSAVFLEAGSFSSGAGLEMANTDYTGNETYDIYEGCNGTIIFSRLDPNDTAAAVPITITIAGTASSGPDYTAISTNITIPIGAPNVSVNYSTLFDGLAEGTETIIVNLPAGCPCDNGSQMTINIKNIPTLTADITATPTTVCENQPVQLCVTNLSIDPAITTYQWSNFAITACTTVNPTVGNNTYYCTVSDPCSQSIVLEVTIPINLPPNITNVTETCTGASYIVSFQDINTTGTPSVDDVITGSGTPGSWVGNTWTSGNIPNQTNYAITVTNACGSVDLSGYKSCGCITYAGSMLNQQNLISLCEDECASNIINNNDFVNDGNDFLEYYLHTGMGSALTNPVAHNTTGTFCFTSGMIYGLTYYISAVAGNNSGGFVDLADTCLSVAYGRPVKWYQIPSPDAGPATAETCDNSYVLHGTTNVGTGVWTSSPAVIFSDSNDPNATIAFPSGSYGNFTLTWTVTNVECSASDNIVVTHKQTPVVNAGSDITICGPSFLLVGTTDVGTGSWTGGPNGTTWIGSKATVPIYGTHTFTYTVSNSGCSSSDDVKVTFVQVPSPDLGANQLVCGISYQLNNTISNTGYGTWYRSDANGYTYGVFGPVPAVDIHNPNATYNVGSFAGGDTTVTLIWTEINGQCPATDSVEVTFALPPNSYAGSDISMCGTNTTLSGNSDGWSNGTWTGPTGVGFTDLHDPSTSLSTVAGSIYGDTCRAKIAFVWTLDNMGCTSSDTVLANMYQKSIASAGNDTTWCGLAVRLNGRPSINCYVGEWTVVPGTTGVTIPTNQIGVPKANITVAGEGVYTLVWTEKNQYNVSCKSTDTVKITVWKYPNINAGNDTTFCGNNGFLHATSGGYSSAWVPVSSASYVDASSPTTNVTWGGAPNTNVSFTYQESNHTCTSQDTVKVKFALKPVSTVFNEIMPDTNKQCGLTYIEGLQAPDPPANLDHYWTCPLTADEVYASGNTSPLTQVTVPSYGVHYFYWVLDNDGCADTSEAVAVNFIKVPTSDAGGGLDNADTLCGHIFDLQAIPSMGTGTWASSTGDGNVVFTDSSQASTTVNINYDDGRVVEILWTEDNNGCYDSDTLHLTVAPIPSANWSWQMPKCVGYSASIIPALNTVDTLPTFNWSFGLESQIDSINLDTIGVPHSGPWYVSWPNSTDPYHIVTLSTVNSWGCPSIIQTDTIYEPPTLGVTFAVVEDTCNAGKGQLVATGYGGTGINYAYSWQTPVTGLPSVATQTGLLAGTYTIQVLDENQCKELLSVSIPMVGMVTAMFDTLSLLDEGIAPDSVEFINESINAPTCMWYFDDNTTFLDTLSYYGKHVLHTYLDSGYYTIKLVAISELGCVDTFVWGQKHVKPGSMLEVANIFTPNGDGHNDIFKVNSRTLSNFKGLILDRWGKTMYEWTNEAEGWNGKVDGSGGEASPGVYFYIITGRGEDGRQYEFKGAFHLIREK